MSSESSNDESNKAQVVQSPGPVRIEIKRLKGAEARLLVLNGSESLSEILTKAQAKLLKENENAGEGEVFSKAFLGDVAVSDVDELFNGDKITFVTASEENEYLNQNRNSSEDNEKTQVAKNRFLHNVASAAILQASSLYDQTSGFVKNYSPSLVKVSVERAEEMAKASAPLLIEKLNYFGSPLLNWADDQMDVIVDSVKRRKSFQVIRDGALTQKLNEILRIRLGTELFFQKLTQSFQVAQTKAGTAKADLTNFIVDLKSKLGTSWDEKLYEPAKAFFERAVIELDTLKSSGVKNITQVLSSLRVKLGPEWENRIQFNSGTQLFQQITHSAPAELFYTSAVQSYLALQKSSVDGVVIISDFLGALKVRLGVWSQDLLEPAKKIFSVLSTEEKDSQNNSSKATQEEQSTQTEQASSQ